MGKNHFTEEQQEELRGNPYIKKVSAKSVIVALFLRIGPNIAFADNV